MLNIKKHCIGGLLALSIGGMALAAHADPATQAHAARRGPPTPEMMAKFAEKAAKRQEELHAKLKLTAAQEPAWTTFVEQTKPQPRSAAMQRPDRDAASKLTTPERMALHLTVLQTREAALTKRLDAVKTFYAVLTPAQQKVFDAEHAHGRFGKHGHHHRDQHGKPGAQE